MTDLVLDFWFGDWQFFKKIKLVYILNTFMSEGI